MASNAGQLEAPVAYGGNAVKAVTSDFPTSWRKSEGMVGFSAEQECPWNIFSPYVFFFFYKSIIFSIEMLAEKLQRMRRKCKSLTKLS